METVNKLPLRKTENEELRSMWMSNNNYSLRHDNIQGCLVDSMHISHTQNQYMSEQQTPLSVELVLKKKDEKLMMGRCSYLDLSAHLTETKYLKRKWMPAAN